MNTPRQSSPRQSSLRWRLLRRLGMPLGVILVIGAAGNFALANYISAKVHDHWLYDSAMSLAEQVVVDNGKLRMNMSKDSMTMFYWDAADRMFGNVQTLSGDHLFGRSHFPAAKFNTAIGKPHFFDVDIRPFDETGLRRTRMVAVKIANPLAPDNPILIRAAETTNKRQALATQILLFAIGLQTIILLFVAAVVWYGVVTSLRTVSQVSDQLGAYGPNSMAAIPDLDSHPTELKPFLNSLNGLIGRLAAAQATQKRFISNAAHQLRTPLATLRIQAERALREPDPTLHREALSTMLDALTRSGHMVSQLLTLARSEGEGGDVLRHAAIDLPELVRAELENWLDTAQARDIDLGYEGADSGIIVQGEPQLLREMIGNLVDNAIRYSDDGGEVTVSLETGPVRLTVDDNGPGIPQSERALVFERFYRGRNDQAGCGLGLPIAREIASRHGASLEILDTSSGKGTRIAVTFASA